MRLLFELDKRNYAGYTHTFFRPSARSIIVKDGRVAMVHSQKYDYYKFPGGGIEAGENHLDALIRETLEEAGLKPIPETIREYGLVRRIQKGKRPGERYVQENFYYRCEVEEGTFPRNLDDYEAAEGFTLEYVTPELAIQRNRTGDHGPKDPIMLEREARVLEMLLKEGLES